MYYLRNKLLLFLATILLMGCATPRVLSLSQVTTDPETYRDTLIQLSGIVKESIYNSNGAAVWELIIAEGGREIYCYRSGYNMGIIAQAALLAEKAKKEEGIVTVTGRLKVAHGLRPESKVVLRTFAYKGKTFDLERWDYPPYYGPYYYGHRFPHFSRPFHHHFR